MIQVQTEPEVPTAKPWAHEAQSQEKPYSDLSKHLPWREETTEVTQGQRLPQTVGLKVAHSRARAERSRYGTGV
jgi:hypothetical protein